MTKKRANNEGTIYFHKTRGRWVAQVSLEGRRITKYGKTQKECRTWVKEMLTKIEGGLTYSGLNLTLERYMTICLNSKELSQRPKTLAQYRMIASQYITPTLGRRRMQDIRPFHIHLLYQARKEEGKGARTLQLIHTALHSVLKQAVREGLITRNPVDAVQRPKVEQAEFQILNETEAHRFLDVISGHRLEALYYLALMTGMREGELLGLKWSDLDWDRGILLVQRQLQRIKGQGRVMVPPKTKAARRQIKLGQGTLAQLAAHRGRLALQKEVAGDRWEENDLVFPNTVGKPTESTKLIGDFKRLMQKNGLPDIRFHDLRHTSISFLLDLGTPINTVQQRAGHSKASVTTDTYGHSIARSQVEAAENIENYILNIAGRSQSK